MYLCKRKKALVPFYISFIIAGWVFFMRAITLHEEYTWNWRYIYTCIWPNNGPADLVNIIVLSCKDMLRRIESKLNHFKRRWTKNFPFVSCHVGIPTFVSWKNGNGWKRPVLKLSCISWQAYIYIFFELKVESQEKGCLLRFHPTIFS
jgi:hypothetical protein